MTIAAINWVLNDAPGLPAHAFGVLLGLANHAREDGTGAYASQATLAGYARKTDRAVRNDIKELLALGLIVVSPNQNPAAHIPADVRPVVYDLQIHLKASTPGSTVPDASGSTVPNAPGSPLPGRKQTSGSTASNARKPTSDKPSTNQTLKKKTSSSSGPNADASAPRSRRKRAPKKPKTDTPPRADVDALCQRLAELMIANGCKSPAIGQAWRDEARRMLDLDKRPFTKAMALLEWCQNDFFWKSNIHSMAKFRAQYDQLRLRANAEWEQRRSAANGHAPRRSTTDERLEQADAALIEAKRILRGGDG